MTGWNWLNRGTVRFALEQTTLHNGSYRIA